MRGGVRGPGRCGVRGLSRRARADSAEFHTLYLRTCPALEKNNSSSRRAVLQGWAQLPMWHVLNLPAPGSAYCISSESLRACRSYEHRERWSQVVGMPSQVGVDL
jgi:hypothetical protein